VNATRDSARRITILTRSKMTVCALVHSASGSGFGNFCVIWFWRAAYSAISRWKANVHERRHGSRLSMFLRILGSATTS